MNLVSKSAPNRLTNVKGIYLAFFGTGPFDGLRVFPGPFTHGGICPPPPYGVDKCRGTKR